MKGYLEKSVVLSGSCMCKGPEAERCAAIGEEQGVQKGGDRELCEAWEGLGLFL